MELYDHNMTSIFDHMFQKEHSLFDQLLVQPNLIEEAVLGKGQDIGQQDNKPGYIRASAGPMTS